MFISITSTLKSEQNLATAAELICRLLRKDFHSSIPPGIPLHILNNFAHIQAFACGYLGIPTDTPPDTDLVDTIHDHISFIVRLCQEWDEAPLDTPWKINTSQVSLTNTAPALILSDLEGKYFSDEAAANIFFRAYCFLTLWHLANAAAAVCHDSQPAKAEQIEAAYSELSNAGIALFHAQKVCLHFGNQKIITSKQNRINEIEGNLDQIKSRHKKSGLTKRKKVKKSIVSTLS